MGEKKLYWIGKGTFFHKGKTWDTSQPIPPGVSRNFLKDNIEKGNIGGKIGAVGIVSDNAAAEIEKLNAEIKDLKTEIELLKEAETKAEENDCTKK